MSTKDARLGRHPRLTSHDEKSALPNFSHFNAILRTLQHRYQRYNTIGDYQNTPKGVRITISHLPDWRYEFLIAIHELVEWAWVKENNISLDDVDVFDIKFEQERQQGHHGKFEEPGDSTDAPYHRGHVLATDIERQAAAALGVSWDIYEATLTKLITDSEHHKRRA